MLCMKTTHKYKANMEQYHTTDFFTCEQSGESQASDSQSGDDQSKQDQSNQDHSNQGQSNQDQSNNNQHFANEPSGGFETNLGTEAANEGLCCALLIVVVFFKLL